MLEISGIALGHREKVWKAEVQIWPMLRRSAIIIAVLVSGGSAPAHAQSHSPDIPSVPDALLSRPVPLRTGIGRAHDTVSTRVAEAQAFYDQGLAYLHGYMWIEAARSFNAALARDPQLAIAYAQISVALTELNKPDAARAALQKAQQLAAAPSTSAHDRLHIAARAAQAAAEAAPGDRARLAAYRSALDAALHRQPADSELLMARGIAESSDPADRGQGSVASAVPYYEKALAAGGPGAHHYLTHAYENSGQFVKAVEQGAAYAALAPAVPHALHMHGHVLRRTGQIQKAIAAFEQADRVERAYVTNEKILPEYEWHHEHNLDLLGSSYQYLGQMAKAERELEAAFDLPSSLVVQMYDKRGWPEFLIARGRLDEALAAAQVLVAHPVSLVKATGHIEAAHVHLVAGRFAQAAEQTNLALRMLRSAPGGQALVAPALQQIQGEFFLRTGDRDKAHAMLQDLVRTVRALPGPDNWVQALFTLESIARTARAAADWPFAAWAAQQMLEHDPGYAGSHYAAALAARHAGDQAVSAREFAAAARLWAAADPTLPEWSEIKASSAPRRRTP
jgi:tetratricopeptide (TPR) repeat protein